MVRLRLAHQRCGELFKGNVDNWNVIIRFVCFGVGFHQWNGLDCLHPPYHSPKDRVLVIQPRLRNYKRKENEELSSSTSHMRSEFRLVPVLSDKGGWGAQLTVGVVVMKNCEPFVLGPALAMLSVYGRSCRSVGWNSSSNSPPQMLSPPVPIPRTENEENEQLDENLSLSFLIHWINFIQIQTYLMDLQFVSWSLWWRDGKCSHCKIHSWHEHRNSQQISGIPWRIFWCGCPPWCCESRPSHKSFEHLQKVKKWVRPNRIVMNLKGEFRCMSSSW